MDFLTTLWCRDPPRFAAWETGSPPAFFPHWAVHPHALSSPGCTFGISHRQGINLEKQELGTKWYLTDGSKILSFTAENTHQSQKQHWVCALGSSSYFSFEPDVVLLSPGKQMQSTLPVENTKCRGEKPHRRKALVTAQPRNNHRSRFGH